MDQLTLYKPVVMPIGSDWDEYPELQNRSSVTVKNSKQKIMSKAPFKKFIDVKPKGAKKKEALKQEKRSIKKEREAFFDNQKREKRKAHKESQEQREFFEQTKKGIKPTTAGQHNKFKPAAPQPLLKPETNRRTPPAAPQKKVYTKERTVFDPEGKPLRKRLYAEADKFKSNSGRKSFFKTKVEIEAEKKAFFESNKRAFEEKKLRAAEKWAPVPEEREQKVFVPRKEQLVPVNKPVLITKKASEASMPLNKFVAHCGVCSRRDAAELVKQGKIEVNNKPVKEPGYKVLPTDVVKFEGKEIKSQNNLVYILLNKPKDFLTTADDPQGRKTVMDLIGSATAERVYPVGRLDRNTTGVLLFTNDGDLAQKLTHPKHEIKKIYEVKLDKPLVKADAEKILAGVQLEDGIITPDALAYADNNDKSVIGIEIHSGKNRIVRRLFEHLGYDVKNLDRVMFANLTKKNVERGRYRFLNEKEVRNLKFLNASKAPKTETKKPDFHKK
jgi:23S rRNA pseudouridine2605 synthase